MDWKTLLIPALASAATAVLMGKTLRRILLLPFQWISKKTENKVDDQLIKDAEQDLGLEDK